MVIISIFNVNGTSIKYKEKKTIIIFKLIVKIYIIFLINLPLSNFITRLTYLTRHIMRYHYQCFILRFFINSITIFLLSSLMIIWFIYNNAFCNCSINRQFDADLDKLLPYLPTLLFNFLK